MADARPNPDHLLARVQAEDQRARRGKLRIFFGYAAGVGKTYEMLTAARRERDAGVDVVVGYVEPHGRPETEALLEGLEIIPPRRLPYRGVILSEFDLDAMLARRPQLALVDELAHSNAEGCRHTKRWQDVEELLLSGIDVWTTLNVQHIESLNDVIARITGVVVRETLPDAVLEQADEIELIDLTPEELMLRLKAGKVYLPAQAERALISFFQKSNLVALRELSLRQAAHRLHQDVEAARQERADLGPWITSERLLVCVGPSPTSAKIIRTAKRMANAYGGDWMAVAVDAGGDERRSSASRELLIRNLQLAEQLGAETHTLIGSNVAETLLEYARSHNVTKIIAGKTAQPWWKRRFRRTVVEELLHHSGDIDIYVISGEGSATGHHRGTGIRRNSSPTTHYLAVAVVVSLCSAISWTGQYCFAWPEANTVMIFLAGVALIATRFGRWPAVVGSIASAIVVEFFFLPPYRTFALSGIQYFITFAVMLGIALLISALAARQQAQLRTSQAQEQRTAKLFKLTRQLSELTGVEFLLQTAGRQLKEFFGGEAVVYLREPDGPLSLRLGEKTSIAANPQSATVAQWVADHDSMAGAETDTLPSAPALFVPLIGSQRTVGTLGVRPADVSLFRDLDQRRLLETCASLIALSIERDQSVLEAQQSQVEIQAEQLRNSLLSSVSHDLRTPLAAIAGTAANLSEELASAANPRQRGMLQSLVTESHQLVRLVENLLDVAKLESGSIVLNRQWQVLEEIIGSAIRRMRSALGDRVVNVQIQPPFPLIYVDGLLLEQLFINLLENACRYTPAESRIEISAQAAEGQVRIVFADNGPGLLPGTENKVFDKFFHAMPATADGRRGVGLGLTICKGIVEAHQGQITAVNRPAASGAASDRAAGGVEFVIVLPCPLQSSVTIPAAMASSTSCP